MKNKISKFILSSTLILGFAGVSLASCGSSSTQQTIELYGPNSLEVGQTLQLKLLNFEGKVIWSTSNNKIATVSQTGVVTGLSEGQTNVVCKLENGSEYSKEITVTAKLNYKTLEVTAMPLQTTFNLYDTLNLSGLKISEVTYQDGKKVDKETKEVFNYTLSIPNGTILNSKEYLGKKTIKVSSDDSSIESTSFEITVIDKSEGLRKAFESLINKTNYTVFIKSLDENQEVVDVPFIYFEENAYYNTVLNSGYGDNATGVFPVTFDEKAQKFTANEGYSKSQRIIQTDLYRDVVYSFRDFSTAYLNDYTSVSDNVFRFPGQSDALAFFATRILTFTNYVGDGLYLQLNEDNTISFRLDILINNNETSFIEKQSFVGSIGNIGTTKIEGLDVNTIEVKEKDINDPKYSDFKKVRELLETQNYVSDLGSIVPQASTEVIEVGKVYNTPNYIYYDYSDRFIEYARKINDSLPPAQKEAYIGDEGYIKLPAKHNNENSKEGVYQFRYDGGVIKYFNNGKEDNVNPSFKQLSEVRFNPVTFDLLSAADTKLSDSLLVELMPTMMNVGSGMVTLHYLFDSICASQLYVGYNIANSNYNQQNGFQPIGAGLVYQKGATDKDWKVELYYIPFNPQQGLTPVAVDSFENFGQGTVQFLEDVLNKKAN